MSDSPKFVAVIDKATGRTFYMLMTQKQESELVPATTPAPAPAVADTPAPTC